MGGICGILRFDGRPVSPPEIEAMAGCAPGLSPDDIHYHYDGPLGVAYMRQDGGMRDRQRGALAVSASDGHIVVAHARLDNRKQLQDDQTPKMASDAELILTLMRQRGDAAIDKLLGDFAFVWWNPERGVVHLARDAMGMKTLYYRLEHNRVLFASQAHQLLAASGVPKKLNERAVAWHLAGMQTPAGISFYAGIEELEPAELVTVNLQGQCQRRQFWQPTPDETLNYRDDNDYVDHLREILLEAVRCRLDSIASPVAISLSGGMDSASVASMAGWLKQQGEPVAALRAYSWAFNEFPQCDERENIYRVASAYHIPVHEIDASTTYPLHDLSLHVPHPDDPFMTIYQAFMHKGLAAARRDGATSMIYGNRGDVICGGSVRALPGLLAARRWPEARDEWRSLRQLSNSSTPRMLFATFLKPASSRKGTPWAMARKVAQITGLARPLSLGADHVRQEFLARHGVVSGVSVQGEIPQGVSDARRQRYEYVFSSFVTRVMINASRAAAAHGMTALDPWSDRRLASFVLACPQHQVTRASHFKRLPRLAMRGIMPQQAIDSARKVSPAPLYERALRQAAYDNVMALIRDSRCASLGVVDADRLSSDFDDFAHGRVPLFDLWPTLSLELWLRKYW